jgi:hypothetical protein
MCQYIYWISFEWSRKTLECLQVTSPEGASGMQSADLKVEVPGFRGGKAESLGKRGCGEKMEEESKAPGATPASRTPDRHESRLLRGARRFGLPLECCANVTLGSLRCSICSAPLAIWCIYSDSCLPGHLLHDVKRRGGESNLIA